MHIILAVTATHDRFLSAGPNNPKYLCIETYHGAQGAALLNQKLSSPIRGQDRDAIWSSAALLGIAGMTSLEASNSTAIWPLKPYEPTDLDWLNMTVGKVAMWRATDPTRPDSIFHNMADEYHLLMEPPTLCGVEEMPIEFVRLCSLDGPLPLDQNPYYFAVSSLSQLLQTEDPHDSMPRHLKFLSLMGPEFRSLLLCRDPRALLIFAYWYASISGSVWWISRRAQLECQAICLYLENNHAGEEDIQIMLTVPKIKCGLISQAVSIPARY